MIRRLTVSVAMFAFAGLILVISVLRTASVKYEFTGVVNGVDTAATDSEMVVNYDLAFPGKVMPDSPFWGVKAVRDKLWLITTTNDTREAELLLLLADKRIAASKIFFERGNPEDGYETLLKAEHYLILAREKLNENVANGLDQSRFATHLATASLKHREVIEKQILPLAPDDARPEIVQTLDTTKQTFEQTTHVLNQLSLPIPDNPFNG